MFSIQTWDMRREVGSSWTWISILGLFLGRRGSFEVFLLSSTDAHTGSKMYWCSWLCIHLVIRSCSETHSVKRGGATAQCINTAGFRLITDLDLMVSVFSQHLTVRVPVDRESLDLKLLLSDQLLALQQQCHNRLITYESHR